MSKETSLPPNVSTDQGGVVNDRRAFNVCTDIGQSVTKELFLLHGVALEVTEFSPLHLRIKRGTQEMSHL